MASEPPPFQEAARCDVCKCSFNAFRRRHHCRCCGRTLCHEHSSNQMALPQLGIYSDVRVCADCFNNSSRSVKDGPTSSDSVNGVADSVSKLAIKEEENFDSVPAAYHEHSTSVLECKCGMPLCICEAPAPPPVDAPPVQKNTVSTVTAQPQINPKPKKINTAPKNRASTSNSRLNSVFNFGQVTDGSTDKPQMEYEVNGEGLREAIKNGDIAGVKKLLSEGVDSNYCDKQGLSLLHLAAVFNQTDITFMLIDHGANVDNKNAQGETPLDCAPATLQYKMRMKMESQQGLQRGA